MATIVYLIIVLLTGLVAGFFIKKLLDSTSAKGILESSRQQADYIIKEAKEKAGTIIKEAEKEGERIKKEKLLQAKEKFLELKAQHEKTILERDRKITEIEKRIKAKEAEVNLTLNQQKRLNEELEAQKAELEEKINFFNKKNAELQKLHMQQLAKLEEISGYSAEEAKREMVESLKEDAKAEAMVYIQEIIEDAKMTAQQEAKKIVINTIQRVGTEEAVENAVTAFHLENDEMKGRIIGREGRNIRAFEAATGVEIIVDDTPETIVLSSFDPVRREIARLSLHKLVTDGRIHPARIEEVVAKTKKQIEEEIYEVGKRTVIDGHQRLTSRTHQNGGPHEIPLVLRTKPLATLARSGQTLWHYGRRTGLGSQNRQTGRLTTRHRQSARRRNRTASCPAGHEMGPKIRRIGNCGQRHRRPPRRNRNEIALRAHRASVRRYLGCSSRRTPPSARILHATPQRLGRNRLLVRRRQKGLCHPSRTRTARHRGKRQSGRRKSQTTLF